MPLTLGQAKCINTLDRSIVVAAGAGSGKTFTLTKRIVRAIESGAVDGIHRVCAITFTNKAAGELKARIKSELRASGLAEQALQVDDAWVSTIHGMCARILRAHAIELDLDPSFAMADPATAEQLLDRAIDEVLLDADYDSLFEEYPARANGPRSNSVESMIRSLVNEASANMRGFDAFVVPSFAVHPAALVDEVLCAYEALAETTATQNRNESRDSWAAETIESIAVIREEMASAPTAEPLWALSVLNRLAIPKRTGTADYKQLVNDAIGIYCANVMELRLAAATPHLDTLLSLARSVYTRFAALKRAAGLLDNNDLLVLASKAVEENPAIAALYTDKFQLVMVDEFQDTDQMQVNMIKRLAGPGACRLCTVGDAQQSIYRFRGADVAVYRKHVDSVRANNPDDVIELPDNFRSHADVLSLVDRVFERSSMFGAEFMSLTSGRDETRVRRPFACPDARITVQLTSNSHRGASGAQVRETAAARIADAFADLHARGHKAGEMAVLLGSMSAADVYAAALRERGFACVITGGSVFARTQEARVVLDLVQALANPYQTEALFNVLTSPLFELDAGSVLELVTQAGESEDVLRSANLCSGFLAHVRQLRDGSLPGSCSPNLVLALRVMGDALDLVDRMPVSRIVERVLIDSGWISRLQVLGAEGLACAANAYKAVRMVKGIERDAAAGPALTARLFEAILDQSKEAPGALSTTGGDFVRIMTVHSSKGLEFPIVAVAEFKNAGGDSSQLLMREVDGRVFLSLDLQNSIAALDGPVKLKSLPEVYAQAVTGCADEDELLALAGRAPDALTLRAALYEQDKIGDEEESKRLLYVALTRAKEALVVSLRGMRTKDNPLATPRDCLGALVPALAGSDEGFPVGVSRFGYGGSAPAVVEHVALEADGSVLGISSDEADASADVCESDGKQQPSEEESTPSHTFMIPVPTVYPNRNRIPCSLAHEGVFSYSSIADASHEGDVLIRLAERFFVSADGVAHGAGENGEAGVDACVQDDATSASLAESREPYGASSLSVFEDDDGAWAYAGTQSADADKATSFGTAFHRLAQYAVVSRLADTALSMPPAQRIAAAVQANRLDGEQHIRLQEALERWFASDIAARMARFESLSAEVPFFVTVSDGRGAPVFLEGEIDLLGLSAQGEDAIVVDYKTGGRQSETCEELQVKHVLQASCYAYALLLQGIEHVEAVFVRVQQPCSDNPTQPQCVRYRFAKHDLPVLEQAIAETYFNGR